MNVNQEADHYNALHDHEGATWSGVYYAAIPREDENKESKEKMSNSYGGSLVFRASAAGDSKLDLTEQQLQRMQVQMQPHGTIRDLNSSSGAEPKICEYAMHIPQEGEMLLFPGIISGPASSISVECF